MSTQQHTPSSVDLEETAELPTLPALAAVPTPSAPVAAGEERLSATDAWIAPSFHNSTGQVAERDLREAEIGALRTEVAVVSESRSKLELNLQNLTANLRELEQLLNSKSEQLSVYEREVGLRDRRIAQLETQSAALGDERTAVSGQRDALHEQLKAARAEAAAAREQIALRIVETNSLQKEYAGRALHVSVIETELAQAQIHTERYRESLQNLEGRRQVFEAMLLDGDALITERELRIAALEGELAERGKHSGAREQELMLALRSEQERVREQDAALSALRTEREAQRIRTETASNASQARLAALEAQLQTQADNARQLEQHIQQSALREQELQRALSTAQERLRAQDAAQAASSVEQEVQRASTESTTKALQEHVAALQLQLQTQAHSTGELAERLKHAAAREQELQLGLQAEQERSQAAAHSAQQRIETLEAEVRAQSESITELRARIGAVRDSLEQRNALIMRLEAETASSAAVLGNIQENLQHMGQGEPTRMLVRTEGDTGIVQLLGRKTTIGRTPDNDLRIDADFISRHHAVILFSGSKTVVEDLNSTNGTFVNGERVSRRMLNEGDLVTIGKTEFRFMAKPANEHAD